MALKILLLAAAAVAVFLLTRPRGERRREKVAETTMKKCAHCGVYHPADESCNCRQKDENGE